MLGILEDNLSTDIDNIKNISRRKSIPFRFSIRITEPMQTAEALLFSAPGTRLTAI